MSWEVAPQCTWGRAVAGTSSVSVLTRGMTGVPVVVVSLNNAAVSNRSARHAAAIASAEACGITPMRASA